MPVKAVLAGSNVMNGFVKSWYRREAEMSMLGPCHAMPSDPSSRPSQYSDFHGAAVNLLAPTDSCNHLTKRLRRRELAEGLEFPLDQAAVLVSQHAIPALFSVAITAIPVAAFAIGAVVVALDLHLLDFD